MCGKNPAKHNVPANGVAQMENSNKNKQQENKKNEASISVYLFGYINIHIYEYTVYYSYQTRMVPSHTYMCIRNIFINERIFSSLF